jgi:hypothetical protein
MSAAERATIFGSRTVERWVEPVFRAVSRADSYRFFEAESSAREMACLSA